MSFSEAKKQAVKKWQSQVIPGHRWMYRPVVDTKGNRSFFVSLTYTLPSSCVYVD